MKKIAILKIGGRIFTGNKIPWPTGECLSLIKLMQEVGHEVHVYTKISNRDSPVRDAIMHDICNKEELNKVSQERFDAAVVVNGSLNFFGGADDPYQIYNYYVMNALKCPINFMFTDAKLMLTQCAKVISGKKWAVNYDMDRVILKNPNVYFLSQLYDNDTNWKLIKKSNCSSLVQDVSYFPFEQLQLLRESEYEKPESRPLDCTYAGSFRTGSRIKKMIEYFFGLPEEINMEVKGTIKEKDFAGKVPMNLRAPVFTPKFNSEDIVSVLATSKTSINFGDPVYEGTGFGNRIYEGLAARQVILVDSDYDKKRMLFKTKEIEDFSIVHNRKEMVDRIMKIKASETFRDKLAEAQRKDINVNLSNLAERFCSALKIN